MKIKPDHYDYLKAHVTLAGATTQRQRWDALYASGLSQWICDNIYSYANDDHIETALKRIAQEQAS